MEYYSPALSDNSDMTEEELEKYLETYIPLSNLPTPPPAKEQHIAIPPAPRSVSTTPPLPPTTHEPYSPEIQAQASHLAALVPANIESSTHCNVDTICGFLHRANLPEEVVAFACCILANLSAKFSSSWREELVSADFERDLATFLRTDEPRRHAHVSPDVIVLAALALAHGFCIDRARSSRHWSVKESRGMFRVKEIEATERTVLRDVDYGLFRIGEEMVEEMRRQIVGRMGDMGKKERRRTLSIGLKGTAMWSLGMQTPEPSP